MAATTAGLHGVVSSRTRHTSSLPTRTWGLEDLCVRQRDSRPNTVGIVAEVAPKYKGTKMREEKLGEMIEKKVKEAREVCEEDERSKECKVAWDEVEEVSQAKADLKLKLKSHDPLENFCQDNPETDECRIYED